MTNKARGQMHPCENVENEITQEHENPQSHDVLSKIRRRRIWRVFQVGSEIAKWNLNKFERPEDEWP